MTSTENLNMKLIAWEKEICTENPQRLQSNDRVSRNRPGTDQHSDSINSIERLAAITLYSVWLWWVAFGCASYEACSTNEVQTTAQRHEQNWNVPCK